MCIRDSRKYLQKGSTHRVSSNALQQRRTDGRRYTRESWKGRRIEKGGNLFIVQAILIAGQSLTYLPLSVSAFLVFFSFYSVLENMFCISLQVVTGCTKFLAFFVTPTLAARSRVPPAVCPSLLENATTDSVCTSFLQSLSAYVHLSLIHI